jgi:rare lipoprotein A
VEAEETGYTSWYGHPYHGRQTASGEVYDMNDLTAAHRTLPLGTRLMVTSLATGQAVEVRVNDRGPFIDGRILDLSYGAALVVGAVGPGVIPVRLRILALPGVSDKPPAASAAAPFTVQVAAFATRARADTLRAAAERDGVDAMILEAAVDRETFYRVHVGP